MKKFWLFLLMIISAQMLMAQTKITLTAGGKAVTATLADSQAARELAALLASGPVAIHMEDYGGFEKVGSLPGPLTAADSRITTSPGDIMLYQGDKMVIFYGTNTWSYTPLGKVDGASAASLREFLGNGSVELTLSLPADTAAELPALDSPDSSHSSYSSHSSHSPTVCDLNGLQVDSRPLSPGIYIVNGRKTLVR